jgi:hypothetical protein
MGLKTSVDFFINYLVIAVAANKSDVYDLEEVEESTGRNFAKEHNSFFKYTSAKMSSGIDDLFKMVGNKYIDPSFEFDGVIRENLADISINSDRQTVKLSEKRSTKPRLCCKG